MLVLPVLCIWFLCSPVPATPRHAATLAAGMHFVPATSAVWSFAYSMYCLPCNASHSCTAEIVATTEKELAMALQDKERFIRLDAHIGLTGEFKSKEVRGWLAAELVGSRVKRASEVRAWFY